MPKLTGKIKPFREPAKTRSFAGLPSPAITRVERRIKAMIKRFSLLATAGDKVFKKLTEVYAAPTMEVIAAQQRTKPEILCPITPAP